LNIKAWRQGGRRRHPDRPAADRAVRKTQAFAGRQKLNRTQFDLNRVVASAFTGLKSTTLQHVDVEFGLASSSCIVVADEDKFARVLEELAQNAAAMDSHGCLIVSTTETVLGGKTITRLPAGHYVRLSVKDTGRA